MYAYASTEPTVIRFMWYMTMPLATPAPPTIRTRKPKPIWMVVACWWKKSTI